MKTLGGALLGALCGFLAWLALGLVFSTASDEWISVLYVVGLGLVVFGAFAGAALVNRMSDPL